MNIQNPQQQNIIYNKVIPQASQTHQQIFNFQQIYYPQHQLNQIRNNNNQYAAQVVKKSGNQIYPIDVEARLNGNEQEGLIDFLFGYIDNAFDIFCNYRVYGALPVRIPKPPPNYKYGYDDNNSFDQAYEDYEAKLLLTSMKQIQQSMQLNLTGITYEQKANLLKTIAFFCTCYVLILAQLGKNGQGPDFNRFLAISILITVIHLLGLRQLLSYQLQSYRIQMDLMLWIHSNNCIFYCPLSWNHYFCQKYQRQLNNSYSTKLDRYSNQLHTYNILYLKNTLYKQYFRKQKPIDNIQDCSKVNQVKNSGISNQITKSSVTVLKELMQQESE
ncbi:hypothetical protein ABPG72_015375 [Tetrahymena utriculariae]